MAINLKCDCGRKLKLRDELARCQIRCPDCAAVLDVPAAVAATVGKSASKKVAAKASKSSSSSDSEAEFVDDAFDDDDVESSSRGGRKDREESNRPRRRRAKQGTSTGLIIGIVLGAFVLLILVGGGIVLLLANRKAPQQIAQNPNDFGNQIGVPPGFQQQAPFDVNQGQPAVDPNNLTPPLTPNPFDNTPPGGIQNPPMVNPVVAAPGDRPWFVLSNFRKQPNSPPNFSPFGSYAVDYQLASGQRNPSQKYVLYIRSSRNLGGFEQYLTTSLPAQDSGTINFSPAGGFDPTGTGYVASIAIEESRREFAKVSGEITIGGATTSNTPPPSVKQLAGAAAQGKLVAIANVKLEKSGPFSTLSLDYVLQGQPDGLYYFLVIKDAKNEAFHVDLTTEFRTSRPSDQSKTLKRQLIGTRGQMTGPFTLHIEKRQTPFPSPLGNMPVEVVSNVATAP